MPAATWRAIVNRRRWRARRPAGTARPAALPWRESGARRGAAASGHLQIHKQEIERGRTVPRPGSRDHEQSRSSKLDGEGKWDQSLRKR